MSAFANPFLSNIAMSSMPVFANPLAASFATQQYPAYTMTPGAAVPSSFRSSVPAHSTPIFAPGTLDQVIGGSESEAEQISQPRMAPHRLGVQPVKGCLKTSGGARGRSVKFPAPAGYDVYDRRIITANDNFRRYDKPPSATSTEKAHFDPSSFWAPSPCDEPMTGMSDLEDLEAMRYREEEAYLDLQHEEAARNMAKNKAGCPYPGKRHRDLHPCKPGVSRKAREWASQSH